MLEVHPVVGLPDIRPGDNVAQLLADAFPYAPGDVVVVTSKVVSKAEGRLVPAGDDREAARLRAIEEKVRSAMDVAWRRTTPSDNPLLTQMREQVAEAEARLTRARAAGDAKRIREAEPALAAKRQFLQLAEHTS